MLYVPFMMIEIIVSGGGGGGRKRKEKKKRKKGGEKGGAILSYHPSHVFLKNKVRRRGQTIQFIFK
jgi:hypothetical protein